ncbi:dnaJ homolog subfamily C member 8-like [Saccoglossus kowalevskii]
MATLKNTFSESSSFEQPPNANEDGVFKEFMTEVKEIEKRDSVLTPTQQIDRLLRPGATYFNLNPFEVGSPLFIALNKAWKTIEDDKLYERCLEIIAEAKEKTEYMMTEKRKKLKKEGLQTVIDEDDEQKYAHAVWVQTCKLFADLERQRRQLEERDMQERKRQREGEIETEEKEEREKEWQEKWEESRDSRVDSWRSWSAGGKPGKAKKKKKTLRAEFKPPKHKAETR